MLYPGSSKPGIIANEQIRIQIVDTHESLETVPRVGFPAGGGQFNRTLLMEYASSTGRDDTCTQRILDLC
jgi:hypothetical protein